MTQQEPKARKGSGQAQPAGQRPSGSSPRQSTSPTGTPRAGRRAASRYHQPEPTLLQRLRTPALVLIVIAAVALIALFAVTAATSSAYACSTIGTPIPTVEGELGQVQPDQGNQHVSPGDKVTYLICPPASGKHINATGLGPIQPKVYGPDDRVLPQGWIHNLEHGGLLLLYRCEGGNACTDDGQRALRAFFAQFPNSPLCNIPAGSLSPVVARFEEMKWPYAALLWGQVLPLETLDSAALDAFFLQQGERSNPEKLCTPPSPTPEPTGTPGPTGTPASTEASPTPGSS